MSYFFLDKEMSYVFCVPFVFSVVCCFKYSVKLSSVCVLLLSVCVDLLQVPGLQHLHKFDLCKIARIVYELQEMISYFCI